MKRISSEQLPKVRLMAVVNLSGVSAEPLLMFPNNTSVPADMNQLGKNSRHPGQEMNTMPPAQQEHVADVQESAKSILHQQSHEQELGENLQAVAKEQTHSQVRENETDYEREQDYER